MTAPLSESVNYFCDLGCGIDVGYSAFVCYRQGSGTDSDRDCRAFDSIKTPKCTTWLRRASVYYCSASQTLSRKVKDDVASTGPANCAA